MQHPQAAQRFDQAQLHWIERVKLAVSLKQCIQLQGCALAVAGQHHPEVLHCRGHTAIVEIHEMRRMVTPEDVTAVAVAVNPDQSNRTTGSKKSVDL